MNKYFKDFLLRGLMFSGFGPIILGIIYAILEKTVPNFALSGTEILVAIISVYLLAFLQAGASVFNQIEAWSAPKALLCHFSVIYFAYTGCYLINRWIPFNLNVLIIFTLIFAVAYFIIWLTVYISVKLVSRKFNEKLK